MALANDPTNSPPAGNAPARIILIETHPDERLRLEQALGQAGFDACAFERPDDALCSVVRLMPDLIVAGDCGDNGDDADRLELLRTLIPWNIPMLALTDPGDDVPALLSAGAADCLERALPPALLQARLSAHLQLGRLSLQAERDSQRLAIESQERRRFENLLHESEENFLLMANAVHDAMIVLDTQGRVIVWNPAAEQIFGYCAEEMVGQELHDILLPPGLPRPQPADFSSLFITLSRQSHPSGSQGLVNEAPARRKDGTPLIIELTRSMAALRGEAVMIAIARDVTERKRILGLIERGKREWESVVDSVDDLILLTGADGRVLRCNRTALARLRPPLDGDEPPNDDKQRAVLDSSRLEQSPRDCSTADSPAHLPAPSWSDILGRTPGELLFDGPDSDARLADLEAQLSPGREVQFPRLEGWFEANIYAVNGGPGSKAYLLKDVTQRKIMETAMLSSQKMASLGALIAGIAHEINSPLQVITGVSESLLALARNGGVPPERLERNLDMIHRNGARVAELVRALRLYAHTSDQVFRPDDLNQVIQDTLLLIEHQLQSWSNIAVITELAPNLPQMDCDREKLAQVLINLLTNARDAMPMGGEITIRTTYDSLEDEVILEVGDNGQGIPQEIQTKVFDPFYTTKPLGEGTGLGLSIVLGVMQTHRGRIRLDSVLREGTRFTMTFPRTQPLLESTTAAIQPLVKGRFDNA